MIDFVIAAFLLIGASFILIAALGLLRFPDLFTRMHATAKASSFGVGCILIGVAFTYPSVLVITKCVMVLLFIFLTIPVATQMIGRAAYLLKVPFWKGTVGDDLKGRYDREHNKLSSGD